MRRVYLLVYSDIVGSREQVKSWANSEKRVITWRYDLPHCFYLVSEASAHELADSLRKHTGPRGRFLISEVNTNRNGWLPPETWYLFKNGAHKPKGA